MFKYMACPNEEMCGKKYVTPLLNETTTRLIDPTQFRFLTGDICSFIIQQPADMKSSDLMYLEVKNLSNAKAYVHKALEGQYKWFSHMDVEIKEQ